MKTRLPALLLACMLCLLVTACGASPDGEQSLSLPVESSAEPSASTSTEEPSPSLPGEYPMELTFSSGAGAWRTLLTLNADGTFTGHYTDSDMGDIDTAYPNGTFYFCSFSGRFEMMTSGTDSNATPLHLAQLTCEDVDAPDEEIKDGVRRIHAGPHGFYHYETDAQAETAILYAPGTAVAELSEEMLSWWPGRLGEDTPAVLDGYALWLPEAGTAFFS